MIPQNPFAAAAQGDLLPLIIAVVIFGAAATTLDAERRRPLVAFFDGVNDLVAGRDPLADAARAGRGVRPDRGHRARSGLDLLSEPRVVRAGRRRGARAARRCSCCCRRCASARGSAWSRSCARSGDALLLAFSTASSSVDAAREHGRGAERLGVSNDVASFVLPTGATLNKNGAAVYKAVTAVFLAHLYGIDLGAGDAGDDRPRPRSSRRSPAPACPAVRSSRR